MFKITRSGTLTTSCEGCAVKVPIGGLDQKLAISSLPVGSTKVTVTYYGDSNIAKSSASVIQIVQ